MSSTLSVAFRSIYNLAFQVSPIILQGGIVASVPGGMMPIIGLTGQLAAFAQGALSNGLSASDFFAEFVPMPGGTIVDQSVAIFPFANQQVAGNATIQNPLGVSLRMIAPVKDAGGYLTKLAIFTALATSLNNHNNAGGTYAVATAARIYSPMIMLRMTDITGDQKQQQIMWQLDFMKPLLSQEQAGAAYGGLMSKIAGGQQISGAPAWSGPAAAINSPVSGAVTLQQNVSGIAGTVNNFLAAPAL